jgi:hypothetical protein
MVNALIRLLIDVCGNFKTILGNSRHQRRRKNLLSDGLGYAMSCYISPDSDYEQYDSLWLIWMVA